MKKDAPMSLKFHFCHSFTPQNPIHHPTLSDTVLNPFFLSLKTVRIALLFLSLKQKQFRECLSFFINNIREMEVPQYFVGGYFGAGGNQFSPEKRHGGDQKSGEPFAIDDLLDFSNADAIMSDGFFDNVAGNSNESSTVTAVDSCNSTVVPRGFAGDSQFSGGELCVPVNSQLTSKPFKFNAALS